MTIKNETKETNNAKVQLGKFENPCLFFASEFEVLVFSWRQGLQIGLFSQIKESLKDSFLLQTQHVFITYPN